MTAAKDPIIDPSEYDLNRVLTDQEGIRQCNLQRYEMEYLTGIVYEDTTRNICVGFLQTTPNDPWVRGHMPGFPLMPGVLICEAAAQVASYFTKRYDLLGSGFVGLGGLEEVRFRGIVRPGDLLVISVQLTKVRRNAMIVCRFQALVNQSVVCEGQIKGVPIEPLPIEGS